MNIDKRTSLKDIEEKDLDLILQWRNQEQIRKVMFYSDIITTEQHYNWYKNLLKSYVSISKIFYFDDKPYGPLNVNQINQLYNTCEWGFYIGELSAPRGMGTILGYTSLNYIFNELHVGKICGEVIASNEQSRIFHEKLGFKNEGILREHIFKENDYMDIHLYSILKREWEVQSINIKQKIEGRDL